MDTAGGFYGNLKQSAERGSAFQIVASMNNPIGIISR
jgi:hypothetical protein